MLEAGQNIERVKQAVEAVRRGELVVVTDDKRRENEGDLVVAAEKATPEVINFMSKHGRGLICVSMEREQLQRLGLSRMPCDGEGDRYGTAFMESVDAREGVHTGISAYDRAHCIAVLIDEHSGPGDVIKPGHIFPLEAAGRGVLERPGHTEAAVDLARLAGLKPAGVICEVLNDEGGMARGAELEAMVRQHGLVSISIAELVAYRKQTERMIRRETQVSMPTPFGVFQLRMYYSLAEDEHHLALIMGEPERRKEPTLVRMHSECLTGDVFGSQRCDCGSQLHAAMARIAAAGDGVILYLRQEGRGIGLAYKLHAYALQESGLDTVEANVRLGFDADHRDYCAAAQMLQDIGIERVRLLTNNPVKVMGLEQYGIVVEERLPLVIEPTEYNQIYLKTKKEKLGHLI